MRLRSPRCLSAALAACLMLSASGQAQVIPFGGNGPGLSPEDNQMLVESIARLNAAEPSRVGLSESWNNPQTRPPAPLRYSECFTRAAWSAIWCAINRRRRTGTAARLSPDLVPHPHRRVEDQGLTRQISEGVMIRSSLRIAAIVALAIAAGPPRRKPNRPPTSSTSSIAARVSPATFLAGRPASMSASRWISSITVT